jgi:hypothetical protein
LDKEIVHLSFFQVERLSAGKRLQNLTHPFSLHTKHSKESGTVPCLSSTHLDKMTREPGNSPETLVPKVERSKKL